jgi:DNA-directed RNA polymerase subunit L
MSDTSARTTSFAEDKLATKIKYKFLSEEDNVFRFQLSGANTSIANALRRTILSDIEINVIFTEPYEMNQCMIHVNTGRLHNEILKQRISSIPIHSKHVSWSDIGLTETSWLDMLPRHFELELDVNNEDGESARIITTEDFRMRYVESKEYLDVTLTHQLFPKNLLTQRYIDVARLQPKLRKSDHGEQVVGERLHLTARFGRGTAKQNSCFNVVSMCTYGNTPQSNLSDIWAKEKEKLDAEGILPEEIAFRKKDFDCLDAQRYFIPDSFDFAIESLGIYTNEELMQQACVVLQEKILALYDALKDKTVPIRISDKSTMENCYDVTLENEDYTLGKVIEYLLFETYYQSEPKQLKYCGFVKEHPHDADSIVRLAFVDAVDETIVNDVLQTACGKAHSIFRHIEKFFDR